MKSNTMRRIFAMTLMLCMLLSTIAHASEFQPIPEIDLSEKLTITFTKSNSAAPDEGTPLMTYWNEKFNVDLQYVNLERNSYNDLIALKVTSGEIPDFFMLDGDLGMYQKFVDQGAIRSIPLDMMKRVAPNLYALQEPYFNALEVDGEIYALTDIKPDNPVPLVCIWRDDWLKNVGIDKIPETLEEAEAAFYAFAQKDPDGNGKNDTYGLGKTGMDVVFGAFGGLPFGPWPQYWMWRENSEGKLVNAAVMPEMKEALTYLAKWYADGIIDPEYVLGENKGGYWALSHDFINNKIGLTDLGHYYHWQYPLSEGAKGGQDYEEFYAANPEGSFAYGVPFKGPDGYSGTWSYSDAIGAAGMMVIGADVDDAKLERILHITETWLFDYDEYLKVNYGIQGTHYDFDKDGEIYWLGDYANSEAQAREGIFINILSCGLYDDILYPNTAKFIQEHFNYEGLDNKLLVSLPSESIFRPDLEKLRDQYYTEIITGKLPVDAFDEFVEKWYANGGEQLTTEANEWWAGTK